MIKISIITVVFNCKNTIKYTLDSILSQDYANTELIVIDGGSTDGTLDILNLYRDQIDILVSEADLGIYDAMNKGLRVVSGDIVGFLHADDLYFDSNVLSKIGNAFSDPSIDAIYGDLLYIKNDSTNKVVRYWRSGVFHHDRLKYGWMPPHPTIYLRKNVYEELGWFNIKYSISADYDFMLRFLLSKKFRVLYLSDIFVQMRTGGISNRSFASLFQKSLEDLSILHHHNIGGIFALLCKNFRKLNQFISR
jgi:glycosyltransferase involved in cell wall biosynthesis